MPVSCVECSMGSEEETEILSGAAEAVCRAQWAVLIPDASNTTAAEVRAKNSVIDPEALVLTSLSFADTAPDLMECVVWWASAGASFTNWGRMQRMAALYGPRGRERLAQFASIRKKRTPTSVGMEVAKWEWPALMVRMRGLFGACARADFMTFLLASDWTHATVSAGGHAACWRGFWQRYAALVLFVEPGGVVRGTGNARGCAGPAVPLAGLDAHWCAVRLAKGDRACSRLVPGSGRPAGSN